jgi:cell wall-associated NlpC family hydrolase
MSTPQVKTPVGSAPVLPLGLLIAGGYLAWFGVHYFGDRDQASGRPLMPSEPVKAVLQGKPAPARPATKTTAADVLTTDLASFTDTSSGGGGPAATLTSSGSGSAISDDALKYKGQGYVFGGPADKPGNWDCSSYASYVLGHDLGKPLPGGHWGDPGFPPHVHGPTTLQYLVYGSAISRDQVAAGDLIVWDTHMGIAISSTDMISAQDEALGTGVAPFDGAIPGETAHYRRVT